MNKEVFKKINTILFLFLASTSPVGVIFFFLALALSGLKDIGVIVAASGYVLLIVFSYISKSNTRYFPMVILSSILIIVGFQIDSQAAMAENENLCAQLRAESSCVEDACGFTCDDFEGSGFVTSYRVCADKQEQMCVTEMNQKDGNSSLKEKVLDKFEDIVLQVVNSPTPQLLDFENERVAVYNCLKSTKENGQDGELDAVARLLSMNLTPKQLNKYYDYLDARGTSVTRQSPQPVAALPNGDPNLTCGYLSL